MINFNEIQQFVQTYCYDQNQDYKKLVFREYLNQSLEKAYCLYLINNHKYLNDINQLIEDDVRLNKIFDSYDYLILFSEKMPEYFLEQKNIKSNSLVSKYFMFETFGVKMDNPMDYSILAYMNLFTDLSQKGLGSRNFEAFCSSPVFESVLAKFGSPSKLVELISNELLLVDELNTVAKWAKLDLKQIKLDISLDVIDLINCMENDVVIPNKNISTIIIDANHVELKFHLKKMLLSNKKTFDWYFQLFKNEKMIDNNFFKEDFLIAIEQDNDFLIKKMAEYQIVEKDWFDLKVFELIIEKQSSLSLTVLVACNLVKLVDFSEYYLDFLLKNLNSVAFKSNTVLYFLRFLCNEYPELNIAKNQKINELMCSLMIFESKPHFRRVIDELQDIIFENHFESDIDSFASMFPDLYSELSFIEKYNTFNNLNEFKQYLECENIVGKNDVDLLKNHISLLIYKIDLIKIKIIENIEVESNVKKNKIMKQMVDSLDSSILNLKILLDILNESNNIEAVFDETKNKHKISFNKIKNGNFGEMKISGLYSFDGNNSELNDILKLINQTYGVSFNKEIDHYIIENGNPPVLKIFETKNYSGVLTYRSIDNVRKIYEQKEYLGSLMKTYQGQINSLNILTINNGCSKFVFNLLQSQFYKVNSAVYDFSLNSDNCTFNRLVSSWMKNFSPKNYDVFCKIEEFNRVLNYMCLMIVDSEDKDKKMNELMQVVFNQFPKNEKNYINPTKINLTNLVKSRINSAINDYRELGVLE